MDKIIEQANKTLKEVRILEDVLFSVVDETDTENYILEGLLDKLCSLGVELQAFVVKYNEVGH